MIKAGYGRIVNIASVAGKEGNPNASHYSASKAGLIGLTKSLGKELAKTGVLVNAVTPAAAKTPIFDSMKQEHIDFMLSKIPMGRFLEVAEAASMITWLSTEDCASAPAPCSICRRTRDLLRPGKRAGTAPAVHPGRRLQLTQDPHHVHAHDQAHPRFTLRGAGADYHDQGDGHWIDDHIATPMAKYPSTARAGRASA